MYCILILYMEQKTKIFVTKIIYDFITKDNYFIKNHVLAIISLANLFQNTL